MKSALKILFLFTLVVLSGVISINYAFAQSLISVETDANSYDEGEIIVISGKVSTIISDTPVTIQIFSQGNLVDIAQITVAEDGSYSYTVIAESPKFPKAGEYTVRASYGEGNIAKTQFNFSPKTDIPTVSILTDQPLYLLGDIISIVGTVQNFEENSISLDIVNPDNVQIWKETVLVKDNGKFSTMLIAGDNFAVNGQYVLTSTYGGAVSKTFFSFKNNNDSPTKVPPIDTDSDGISDSSDSCPTQSETINNYQDTDGCPDTVPSTNEVIIPQCPEGKEWIESAEICMTPEPTMENIANSEPTCGQGTELVNGQCVLNSQSKSLEDSKKGLWAKYDVSINSDSNSPQFSGLNLSDDIGYLQRPYLKVQIEDKQDSEFTMITKSVKTNGNEQPVNQIRAHYGDSIFVIDPNVKIGETLKIVSLVLGQKMKGTENFKGLNDIPLVVKEFTKVSVNGKDFDAIKSTYSKTASVSGAIVQTDITALHDKNTGMLLVFDMQNDIQGGSNFVTVGMIINAVEVSDDFLKPKSVLGGGCLIATATYGSELAPQVQQLRELRDNSLLQTASGTTFMNSFNYFYYSFSPQIADWERESPIFKEIVKITITPIISSLSILNYVDMDSESNVLGYGISLIMLNVGMYFIAPTVVIHTIRKKF